MNTPALNLEKFLIYLATDARLRRRMDEAIEKNQLKELLVNELAMDEFDAELVARAQENQEGKALMLAHLEQEMGFLIYADIHTNIGQVVGSAYPTLLTDEETAGVDENTWVYKLTPEAGQQITVVKMNEVRRATLVGKIVAPPPTKFNPPPDRE
ncbi:MAG: hypothetical protein AB1791_00540 [Chloroflexota bacterium]